MDENKNLIFDIYEKVNGQSDLDWVEIRDKHKLDCHPDSLRKAGVGVKMAAEAGCLNFDRADTSSYADVYKAKKQFYDQRREYNKELAEDARWDHLCEQVVEHAKRMSVEKKLYPKTDIIMPPNAGEIMNNEEVVVLSDWHYGLVADNVWNEYNPEIAKKRIQMTLDAAIRKAIDNSVHRVHIVILGDMIAGSIHVSNRVASCETTINQLMDVMELISDFIDSLSSAVEFVQIYCTYGNHARTIQNHKDSIHEDNLEKMIPFYLKSRFANVGHVCVVEGYHELLGVVVCGHPICCVHGDLDSQANATSTLCNLCENAYGEKPEYIISGHYHTMRVDEEFNVKRIGVGSLCGTDEFAKNKRLFSNPSQMILIFNQQGLDQICPVELKEQWR